MNALDIVILLLFLPGIIRGISKGFLEQAISLAGIVAGVWAAFHFSAAVSEKLKAFPWMTLPENVLSVISFVLILIVVLVLVVLLAKLITNVVDMAHLGWLNRALGFAFSILTSAAVISLLIIFFETLNLKYQLVKSPILEESVLYGHLKDLGYLVYPYLKQFLGVTVTA